MTRRLLGPFSDAYRAAALMVLVPLSSRADGPRMPLVELDTAASLAEWRSVDDRVMGGISRSRMERAAASTARFAGTLSREQGGGFASIRRSLDPSLSLAGWDGIAVRVRGDGRTYQVRLRMDGNRDGVAYRASFPTRPGEWLDVHVRFDAFVPTWRGRRLRHVPPVSPGRVDSIGFMVSGDQVGSFALEIARVEAWRAPRGAVQ